MSDRADAKPKSPARAGGDPPAGSTLGLGVASTGQAPRPTRERNAATLVEELITSYRAQIKHALDVDLDDSKVALAFVDHHLRTATDEDRSPIVMLLAAAGGAYYGELVRTLIGGTWIGDGKDPRNLRLLMRHQFIYFSPVDQALEAIAGASLELNDPRLTGHLRFDPSFRLAPVTEADKEEHPDLSSHDAVWLEERLAELPSLPEDQFVSLTSRFETLELMHEMLATKHAAAGRSPVELGVEDYLEVLAREAQAARPDAN